MNPELVEGLFIRDDDEGLFSRDIDGQLVRLDSPTGPIVATVDIAHTGDWGKFMQNKAKLTPTPGRHDVYLVLTHPKKSGGLMNVDWVEFSQ